MDMIVEQLAALESLTVNCSRKVDKIAYEKFCKDFVFEKLKGKSFGHAFCERFNFNDVFLKALSDSTAKNHIEKLGYIER